MRLSNNVFFQNMSNVDPEPIIEQLESLIEPQDELIAVRVVNGSLQAMSPSVLWYGFHGCDVPRFLEEWRAKLQDIKSHQKEQYCGKNAQGLTITFSRVYGGYRFTDQECEDLLAGRPVKFAFTSQYGNTREITGYLQEKTWDEKEIKFYSIVSKDFNNNNGIITGKLNGQDIRFKDRFADHKYTQSEITTLLRGQEIYISFTNKNGNTGYAHIRLVPYKDDFYKADAKFGRR